jgi:hypothetical protein
VLEPPDLPSLHPSFRTTRARIEEIQKSRLKIPKSSEGEWEGAVDKWLAGSSS